MARQYSRGSVGVSTDLDEQIGHPTPAASILGRLVHNAYRMKMRGDSMRKSRSKANA